MKKTHNPCAEIFKQHIKNGDLKAALSFLIGLDNKHLAAIPIMCGFTVTSLINKEAYFVKLFPQLKKACANRALPN